MKIGILQCGRVPEELFEEYGDYDRMFETLLQRGNFEFQTYAVLDNCFPDDIQAADGWLITGSRFGVYEDHIWIPPLEEFLRAAYDAGVPIVGICFGHQILAQALGGKVEKLSGGWSLGQVDYERSDGQISSVQAFHQDQVVELPDDATVTGFTPFCKYAFLTYGKRALTMQPHPEFSDEFVQDLLIARGEGLPEKDLRLARERTGKPLSTQHMIDEIIDFYRASHDTASRRAGAEQ
ncbi:MAG: type 1 glutamine amidotransferase [Gammaproteobacteria bacterium]|nr:type 1 glutamine amidotransferase [Gammaproteobacteria bacterium]